MMTWSTSAGELLRYFDQTVPKCKVDLPSPINSMTMAIWENNFQRQFLTPMMKRIRSTLSTIMKTVSKRIRIKNRRMINGGMKYLFLMKWWYEAYLIQRNLLNVISESIDEINQQYLEDVAEILCLWVLWNYMEARRYKIIERHIMRNHIQ
jgi:hypothetical protein